MSARRRSYPLARVYGLLEPGPVVLIATARAGRPNVMAQSWHTMIDFEPPLVGCVVSDRSHTYATLRASRECVIAIPTAALIEQVVGCGNTSGRSVNKFERFHLTPERAAQVQAPLIAECYANLECKVIDTRLARRYDLFILQVVKAWVTPSKQTPRTLHHLGRGTFMVAGRRIETNSRMM